MGFHEYQPGSARAGPTRAMARHFRLRLSIAAQAREISPDCNQGKPAGTSYGVPRMPAHHDGFSGDGRLVTPCPAELRIRVAPTQEGGWGPREPYRPGSIRTVPMPMVVLAPTPAKKAKFANRCNTRHAYSSAGRIPRPGGKP